MKPLHEQIQELACKHFTEERHLIEPSQVTAGETLTPGQWAAIGTCLRCGNWLTICVDVTENDLIPTTGVISQGMFDATTGEFSHGCKSVVARA